MSHSAADLGAVRGIVDADGRLIEADPPLLALHARAGGRPGGALAVPQVAALARLARRLDTTIARPAIAADGDSDLDLWVRAAPSEGRVELAIGGWTHRPARQPAATPTIQREGDFVRAAADWVWETDETLRLTLLSPAAAAAIGAEVGRLVGHPLTGLFRFVEGDEGAMPILDALASRGRFEDQRAELRSGSRAACLLSGVPLVDGNGAFAGFRGSAVLVEPGTNAAPGSQDHSEFGEKLEKALRDPLDHIIAEAERIGARQEGDLAPDYEGYAIDIASAGRHLLSLVDDLVDLQAVERPDFAPAREAIDLAEIARQAAGLLAMRAAERQVRLTAPGSAEQLHAIGEHRRVLQIVVNLVSNAIHYSPADGDVRIEVKRDGTASLCVSDEGKGVPREDRERIFGKFERLDPLDPGGTGLGLYIARRLARAMGGDLQCEGGEPGASGGACFKLTLPAKG